MQCIHLWIFWLFQGQCLWSAIPLGAPQPCIWFFFLWELSIELVVIWYVRVYFYVWVHWIIRIIRMVHGIRHIKERMVRENTLNSHVKYLHHPKRIINFVESINEYLVEKRRTAGCTLSKSTKQHTKNSGPQLSRQELPKQSLQWYAGPPSSMHHL